MTRQVKLYDLGRNPFFYFALICLILAIVLPILAIRSNGWDTPAEPWIIAGVLLILFGIGTGLFGWLALK